MKSWVTSGLWAGESHLSMYGLNPGCSKGTCHQLQEGWFHPFSQENTSLSHPSPSKSPGFLGHHLCHVLEGDILLGKRLVPGSGAIPRTASSLAR